MKLCSTGEVLELVSELLSELDRGGLDGREELDADTRELGADMGSWAGVGRIMCGSRVMGVGIFRSRGHS